MKAKLPNFLIIGVQKAGTSSIYHYLKQHPQVYMSPIKETNFFARDWEQEPSTVQAQKKNGIITLADYTQCFSGVTDEIAIGEASPNYLFRHPVAVDLIQQHLPQAKLIAILRDPVQRAYSDYLMHIRDAINTKHRTLREQLETRSESSFTLLKGKYYEGIKHFLETFGPEQVKVYLYDDLNQDTTAFMKTLYTFIGVDPTFEPNTSVREQKTQVPKNQTLNRLIRTQNPLRNMVSLALRNLMSENTRFRLRSQLLKLNSDDHKSTQSLSNEDRQLLLDYYRDDILKLQDLLQRDLSAWLT